jgi:ATP-binding cassette subfamily F protein uup
VAYFDQLREHLDPEKNLIDNICGGQEFIDINGKRKHAITYLGDFLFTPDRIRTPAKALSGGEQNRAILAKVFSKPANLLVLDEPTNDLDIETLELLEEILLQFEGTVLLVSHDRQFMDNVVTSILVFEGNGRITERVGGYSDWIAHGGSLTKLEQNLKSSTSSAKKADPDQSVKPVKVENRRNPSYKEKRALEQQLKLIGQLESRQQELQDALSDQDFYRQDQQLIDATLQEVADVQAQLETAYIRWEELES